MVAHHYADPHRSDKTWCGEYNRGDSWGGSSRVTCKACKDIAVHAGPPTSTPKKPKGDHKRKARPIAPATVTVRDGEIVVVVPDVLGKNASHKQSKNGGRRISEQTEEYRNSVAEAVQALVWWGARDGTLSAQAHQGAWRMEVVGVWPTQNHDVGFVAPRGDADAAIPQALDALQHAGILDDDARVVEVRAWSLYRKGVRATVMRLSRVMPVCSLDAGNPFDERFTERDAAIAHLLPLVPPAVEPPPKPAKSRRKVKS